MMCVTVRYALITFDSQVASVLIYFPQLEETLKTFTTNNGTSVSGEGELQEVNIQPLGTQLAVFNKEGKLLGFVPAHVSAAIAGITKIHMLCLEGYIFHGKPNSDKVLPGINISINLYGQSLNSDAVGDLLYEYKCFLQHPKTRQTSVKYQNPHTLIIPDEFATDNAQNDDAQTEAATQKDSTSQTRLEQAKESSFDQLFLVPAELKAIDDDNISPWIATTLKVYVASSSRS